MTAINAHHTSRHNATAPQTGRTGDRVELTHYTVAHGGERLLYGQRVNGSVRVTDVPRTPGGRAYLVERDLQLDGNTALRALVSDYLAQSKRLNAIPMACSPLEQYLQHMP